MKRMFLKKRLCFMMVMILAIATVFMGKPMTVKAAGTITVTVSGDTTFLEEIKINNQRLSASGGSISGENEATGNNTITLAATPTYTFDKIEINNSDVTSSFNINGDQASGSVAGAQNYDIKVTIVSSGQKTITWAYDDAFGSDAKVENGTVTVLQINDGQVVDNNIGTSGNVIAEPGKRVLVELKPAYGYQISGALINGVIPLEAKTGVSTFEFEMPNTEIHFKGLFVPASDKVTNGAGSVVKDVSIGNGNAIAGDSGNAEVILDSPNSNVTTLPVALENGKEQDTNLSAKSVNIATRQIVSKGDGTYWETPQTSLSESVELALTVDAGATGYAVIREHSGENPTEIPSYYDPATGSLIFASDKFSTYTFVPLTTENNNYTPRYDHSGGGSSTSSGSNKGSSNVTTHIQTYTHIHQFEWQTITAASAEQDGLEAYACTICGFYKETVPVSAYSYACTEAAKKVLTAKQNDTLILKMGRWHSYPKWFMEKLASRSDLTIKLQFEYQHKQYELNIPAGTKIDTECNWYGPLKLCSLYEFTVK